MSLPHTYSVIAAIMGTVVGSTAADKPRLTAVTGPFSVNEGANANITVNTANFPDGTTQLNWSINHISTSAEDFSAVSGTVNITSSGGVGSGTFIINPGVDGITDDGEEFTVTVSGTVDGTALTRTSASIRVNDIAFTDIPAGTFFGRSQVEGGSSTPVAIVTDTASEDGGPAVATATVTIRMFHSSQDGGSFAIQVYKSSGTAGIWFDTNGNQDTLEFPQVETPPVIYRNSITPTAIKFEVTTNGGNFNSSGWDTVPNVGDGRTTSLTTTVTANSGEGRKTDSDVKQVKCFGRADGYNDTLLAIFSMSTFVAAESDF